MIYYSISSSHRVDRVIQFFNKQKLCHTVLTQNVSSSADATLVVDGIWKLDRRHYTLNFHLSRDGGKRGKTTWKN